MKNTVKSILVLSLMTLVSVNSLFATTRRVNNNSGVTGILVYATLQAAYDISVAGDTLIIEGSNTSYGNLTLTKRLILFGPGYHLTQNAQTQANLLTASLDDVIFGTGSNSSVVSGLVIKSITVNQGVNDVLIARNYISPASGNAVSLNTASNIVIQQNIIRSTIVNVSGKAPSVVIQNNLLDRVEFSSSIAQALISHNVVSGSYNNSSGYSIDVNNATITDNIFNSYYYSGWGSWHGTLKFEATQNNTIVYNIFNQPDPNNGVGANNQFSIGMSTIFTSPSGDVDKNYVILPGSLADGWHGDEAGMFGGDYSYVLSGLAPIPHIYMLDADPAGNNTNPLDVKISVKSQN